MVAAFPPLPDPPSTKLMEAGHASEAILDDTITFSRLNDPRLRWKSPQRIADYAIIAELYVSLGRTKSLPLTSSHRFQTSHRIITTHNNSLYPNGSHCPNRTHRPTPHKGLSRRQLACNPTVKVRGSPRTISPTSKPPVFL